MLDTVKTACVELVVGFAIMFALFRTLDRCQPAARRMPFRRRGFGTDLAYWVFTPLVTTGIANLAVLLSLVPFALIVYGRIDQGLIEHGFGPAARLPLWIQAIAILVLGDFMNYWAHRWFHGRRMWRFHAIHHSSVDLDWLSALRTHPLNDVLMRLIGTIPILALGFAPIAIAGIVPVLAVLAVLLHANVDWDWGPLRRVFVSPRFHRWHHTDEAGGRDKNFAGVLPLWDILFGTYYMPSHRRPDAFGTSLAVPAGLIGQLIFPFNRH